MNLRDAAASSAYSDALATAYDRALADLERLPTDRRAELAPPAAAALGVRRIAGSRQVAGIARLRCRGVPRAGTDRGDPVRAVARAGPAPGTLSTRIAAARGRPQRALAVARDDQYLVLQGGAHTALAHVYLHNCEYVQASAHARQALGIHRETGNRLAEARTLLVLGNALQTLQGRPAATPHWRAALDVFTAIGTSEAGEVRTLLIG